MVPIEIEIIDLSERFGALCRQEEEFYGSHDYLSSDYQAALCQKAQTQSRVHAVSSLTFSSCSSGASSKSEGINEVWREKICEWTFQIIDYFNINREIASISLNYLDRYLSKRTVSRKMFQLAALTSLFLAIKLYKHATLRMSSFIKMSRGHFKMEDIAFMEGSILSCVSYVMFILYTFRLFLPVLRLTTFRLYS